jgi:hypothetical protein
MPLRVSTGRAAAADVNARDPYVRDQASATRWMFVEQLFPVVPITVKLDKTRAGAGRP